MRLYQYTTVGGRGSGSSLPSRRSASASITTGRRSEAEILGESSALAIFAFTIALGDQTD